jgi:hypothetical protein
MGFSKRLIFINRAYTYKHNKEDFIMKTAFRQGIVRYQQDPNGSPQYIVVSANDDRYLDLVVQPDPCVITFAHGSANYTIEEVHPVVRAWGPFQPQGETQYLFWDIDTLSGQLSRGYTLLAPFTGPTAPTNPRKDQHWFNVTTTQMKVWSGESWVTKIRVFAGRYGQNAVFAPQFLGSQIGDTSKGVSGTILFDDRLKPLRAADQTFLTTETNFQVLTAGNNTHSEIRFESLLTYVQAAEYIPAYSAVSLATRGTIMLARYTNTNLIINGIVSEDMFISDISRLITSGVVYNEQWNFPADKVGKPLFCGITGEITLTPPPSGVVQMIGTIDSRKSINVAIQAPIYYAAK